MRKKEKSEVQQLLARIETMPPETRGGILKFLKLVISLESEFEEYVPPVRRSEDPAEDIRELRGLLLTHLQGGSPERSGLVGDILACAEKAYSLGQEDSSRLFVQVGIVVAAKNEQMASFIIQNAACNAALEMVRAAAR